MPALALPLICFCHCFIKVLGSFVCPSFGSMALYFCRLATPFLSPDSQQKLREQESRMEIEPLGRRVRYDNHPDNTMRFVVVVVVADIVGVLFA
ncbi:hypothetical protein EDD21DRAFT_381756 [Dissophora ornata]|nr:hypothetical protein EDD21DRAFT_381756 [Dissophora ornata]